MSPFDSPTPPDVEVRLDGLPVELPLDQRSFAGIRSYLESLALRQQRVLCALNVDGESVNLTQPRASKTFSRIEGETMGLHEVPNQLIKAALQQTTTVRARVQSAVELVLINEGSHSRELWWHIATALKEPLLTLSLLPDHVCGPVTGGASPMQLRQWQLQQLGYVIQDVDAACRAEDASTLSDTLEKRVLPWLDNLRESLLLWQEAISSGSPAATPQDA